MGGEGLALWSWCGEGGSQVEGECYESGSRIQAVGVPFVKQQWRRGQVRFEMPEDIRAVQLGSLG